MENKLKDFIETSGKILITSHISPDPDAVCSSLLLSQALKLNHPNKEVVVNFEELPEELEFLKGFEHIQNKPLGTALQTFQPELFIILDANSIGRCTRDDTETVKQHLRDHAGQLKTVMIDHHVPEGRDEVDLYIHNQSPATTQIVYSLFLEKFGLKKPKGYADVALLGIISDTSRFLHDNPAHRETFRITSDLLDAGASIELLTNRTSRYSTNQMKVFGELALNVATDKDYAYTFISEGFKNDWLAAGNSPQELKNGAEIFVSSYLRNIDDKLWGFIAYPELLGKDSMYGISFRSQSGIRDVSAIARALGGGGHKPAAGAKVKAKSVEQAIEIAKKAIEES